MKNLNLNTGNTPTTPNGGTVTLCLDLDTDVG
jgi:hypothetical protein